MAEIQISRGQMRTIVAVAREHKGVVGLTSPPKDMTLGTLNESYVEVELYNADGEVIDSMVFNYAGQEPRKEALPPEWGASDQ